MDLNLILGIFGLGFGLYTAYVRATSPEKLGKLEAMKSQWGDRAGTVVHVVAYTVVPIVAGLIFLASSLLSDSGQ